MRIPLGLAGDETINACTSQEIEAGAAPKGKRQSQGTVRNTLLSIYNSSRRYIHRDCFRISIGQCGNSRS
jgi:hypothetical protein